MDAATAARAAKEIADHVAAPAAADNDRHARFPDEGVAALGKEGLLGLAVPASHGGAGLGPRAFADVVATLSEADASLGMVYTMHVAATAVLAAARPTTAIERALRDAAEGRHLSTLAFSEKGSRSHFWAPVSRATATPGGARLTAEKSWVTSASRATSYVATTLSHAGAGATDTTLYLVDRNARGVRVSQAFDGMGLRGNDSAAVTFDRVEVPDDRRLTEEGAGFATKVGVVLPTFNLGCAALALGVSRAAVAGTASHLKSARFEHLGQSLGEALPNLRAALAVAQIDTDGLAARVDDLVRHLETPGPLTTLRVLESKAAANETAIRVTSGAMRACGGAAYSRHTPIDRYFRDAHAGAVMAPTVEQSHDLIGKALLGLPLF